MGTLQKRPQVKVNVPYNSLCHVNGPYSLTNMLFTHKKYPENPGQPWTQGYIKKKEFNGSLSAYKVTVHIGKGVAMWLGFGIQHTRLT